MRTRLWLILVVGCVLPLVAEQAVAQLFGSRSVGGSIRRRQRPTYPGATTTDSGSNVGTVSGSERFLRGARSAADFVGRDSRDRAGFVGAEQASVSGTVRTAAESLRIETAPDANQGQARRNPARTRMYDPRLRVDFRFTRPPSPQLDTVLTRRLQACDGIHQSSPIVVSVEGEKATLRGVVAAERDRKLAELMLLLEPGISQVENRLAVLGSPPSAAQPVQGSGTRSFQLPPVRPPE